MHQQINKRHSGTIKHRSLLKWCTKQKLKSDQHDKTSWRYGSKVLAIVPKKDLKRTWKGPSKFTVHKDLFFVIYMEDVFMPLTDFVNESGNDEAILSMACLSINWQLWAHVYNQKWYGLLWLQHGGISSASSSQTTIHGTAAKIQLCVRKHCCSALRLGNAAHKWTLKEITTMERTSWQIERTHGLNQRT